MAVLEVESLTKHFGGIRACDRVDLTLDAGEVVGVVGPNGAGKTTLFHCIAGYHRPDGGSVRLMGREITGWPPHRTSRAGIGRTFQIPRVMDDMTVLENVMVGAFCRAAEPGAARERAREVLEEVGLLDAAEALPSEIPLAAQKRMEVARALATDPRVLMLDENAAGLSPEEIAAFTAILQRIQRERSLAMLVIEHVMEFVMTLSHRVVVLAGGRKIAEGTPDQVTRRAEVVEAYLGERYARRS